MSNNKNNKEVSLGLIIVLFFVFPPAAFLLVLFKYIIPAVADLLRDMGFLPKKNRYSGFEKQDDAGFEKSTSDVHANDSEKRNTNKENEVSGRDKEAKKEKTKIPYRTASVVLLIIGGLFLLAGLIDGISMLSEFSVYGIVPEQIASVATVLAIGGIMGGVGAHLQNKVKTIRRYMSVIGKRNVVKLDELRKSFSISHSKVKKELQAVIDSGVFGEFAYIDYGQHIFLRDSSFKPVEPAAEKIVIDHDSEIMAGADEYETTLIKIRRLNQKIADKEVSDKIDLIEQYTGRIFEYIKKSPEKEKNVNVFMTYYLPTTLKLLESYSEIERVGVAGENMRSAKENIEKTLDLLSEAFKKLLDQLYESDNMDITSDIDVLEQMMKKDGLTGSGFTGE